MSFSNIHHRPETNTPSDHGSAAAGPALADAAMISAATWPHAASQSPSPVLRLCAVVSEVARARRHL